MSQTSPGVRTAPKFAEVLDRVGLDVCSGNLAPHTVLTVEDFCERTGGTRGVVREVIRSLISLGLLRVRGRQGFTVREATSWNQFDLRVVNWRLKAPGWEVFVEELAELRAAIEPEGCRLAALHRSDSQAQLVLESAGILHSAGARQDVSAFFTADENFHRLIAESSGNSLFVQLRAVVERAMQETAHREVATRGIRDIDIERHLELARCINGRESERARSLSRLIITEGLA